MYTCIHLENVTARMWNAQNTAQTQANSNANGLIIHPETTCRNWLNQLRL